MHFLEKLSGYLVFSNIFLSLCVTSLAIETYLILYGRIISFQYPFFLFCSTLVLYSFHRIYRFNFRAPEEQLAPRHHWIKANAVAFFTVMGLAIASVVYCLVTFVTWKTFLYLLPIGAICFAYTVPCIPFRRKLIRLRDIPYIKIFLISLVLALTTVLLPVTAHGQLSDLLRADMLFTFTRRMLFIFAITIPFDIRDREYDRMQGTKTFPVVFGIAGAKIAALVALALFALLGLVQGFAFGHTAASYLAALGISAFLAAIVVLFSNEKRSDNYYAIVVEGMMLVQCLLVMGANTLYPGIP